MLKRVNLSRMSLLDLFQFTEDLIFKIEECDAGELKIEPQFVKLKEAFGKLDAALDKERKNERTDIIVSFGKLRDGLTNSILSIVKAMLNSADIKVVAAAKKLKKLFDENKGITRKAFKSQSGATTNLVQVLIAKYSAETALLDLDKLIAQLDDVNKKIISNTSVRVDEWAAANKLSKAAAKKDVISAYRMIEKLLSVYIGTEGEANYSDFVGKLNVIIAGYSGGKQADTTGDANLPTPPTDSDSDDDENSGNEPSGDQLPDDNQDDDTVDDTIPEATHEERMAAARPWTTVGEGEWKNGDYCFHNVNSVKTYWKLLDATKKDAKPYMSGNEAVWEKVVG